MDLNLVVLCGRLAAPPELQRLDSGASCLRLLLAVTSDVPSRRLDLVPVVVWRPPDELLALTANERLWVSGMLQRRLAGEEGRRGIEVAAHEVTVRAVDNDSSTRENSSTEPC